jgi:hypothetical protein
MWSRTKRILTDSKFSRIEAGHVRAEAGVDLPDPAGRVVLRVDRIAGEVARAAVRLQVLAHRQVAAALRLQHKAEAISASSCWRFASAKPGRFRLSPSAS